MHIRCRLTQPSTGSTLDHMIELSQQQTIDQLAQRLVGVYPDADPHRCRTARERGMQRIWWPPNPRLHPPVRRAEHRRAIVSQRAVASQARPWIAWRVRRSCYRSFWSLFQGADRAAKVGQLAGVDQPRTPLVAVLLFGQLECQLRTLMQKPLTPTLRLLGVLVDGHTCRLQKHLLPAGIAAHAMPWRIGRRWTLPARALEGPAAVRISTGKQWRGDLGHRRRIHGSSGNENE